MGSEMCIRDRDKEYIATLKGVDANFKAINAVDSMLIAGDYLDIYSAKHTSVVGQGVAYYLSMNIGNIFDQLQVYTRQRKEKLIKTRKLLHSKKYFAGRRFCYTVRF